MRRQPVVGEKIRSVGFDVLSNTLEVEFGSNAVYRFYAVKKAVFDALLGAESADEAFDKLVKKGGYKHKRMPGP